MIAATQIQILQSLFQHALQFIPEQSDPVDFFEMYFDETQIKKANGEGYHNASQLNGNNQYNQQENKDQCMQQYTESQNLGKGRGMNQSKSSAGIAQKDQNAQLQGSSAISKMGSKQDLNMQQSQQNGQVKKIMVKKLQGSQSQSNNLMNDKDLKQGWKTKLAPIKQPKILITSLSKNNDPFNKQKDGFFHIPPKTAQSQQGSSQCNPRQTINNRMNQTNTQYNENNHNINNVNGVLPSNKNLRSNSNQNHYEQQMNGAGFSSNQLQQKQNFTQNLNNLDNSHNNQDQTIENQGQNQQQQYYVYDSGLKYNPNPYAAGWANAILKEHYKVALKRIDEKNGRKRWIIRKIKMQKDGDLQSNSIQAHVDNTKAIGSSIIANMNPNRSGLMKADNILKKQIKKFDIIDGITDVFTNAFVNKQRQLISSSQPELLEFAELIETLSFDREYIAFNLLNQPITDTLKNINEEQFEENLQPYYEHVAQNIYSLQIYHLNFKTNLERVIFLNKLLICNL